MADLSPHNRRGRLLWPRVRITHRHFYPVFLVLLVTHVALGMSSLLAYHNTPLWFYYGGRPGLIVLGSVHLVISAVMTVGFYRSYRLIRFGMLWSITAYLLKFCLFTAAVVRSRVTPGVLPVSLETPIFTAALILVSLAAYWQPLEPHPAPERLT